MTVARATVRQSVVRVTQQPDGSNDAIVRVSMRQGTKARASLGAFKTLSELLVTLQFNFNGGGIPIASDATIEITDVPFPCRIIGWAMTADQPSQTLVNIFKCAYDAYPNFTAIAEAGIDNVIINKATLDVPVLLAPGDIVRTMVESNTAAKLLSLGVRIVRLSP